MSETQSRLPGIFDTPGVSDARYARQSQDTPGAQRVPGRTSLRDYGAFQADISTLATHRIVAIKDMLPVTPAPVAYPKGRFAGVIKIIPFQTKEMRAQGSATEELRLGLEARGNVQRASRKKAVSFGLRCAITLLMFGLLGKSISWPTLLAGLFHMRLGMVSLSLVVGAGGIVLSAYQWRSLLSGEGIHLDLANLINLYIVGIAFSHFLPTGMGGDAVKAFYVGRESGNNAGSASSVVLCRVIGFVGMLLVAIPALVIWHDHFRLELITTFALLSLLVGGMIGGALAAVTWLPGLLKRVEKGRRVFTKVALVGEALLAAMKRPRYIGVALAYGIAFWALAILNCYAYGNALGIHVPSYFYMVVVPLIALVSFLPVSINGFGLRESAYVYAFSTMHVAPATALLLALLQDTQALLFGLGGGLVYFTLLSKTNQVRTRHAGRGRERAA